MSILLTNFASAQIASPVGLGDTEITVEGGAGAAFPAPAGSDYCVLVAENVSGIKEVMHMTARASDVFTVSRGQESTTPLTFEVGDRIELRITAGFLNNFIDGGEY